ncbi:MAG: DUF72 domain-containing protein [Bryobacterales bacterium]|nr:DUF72 domain-containing protein [Bryobacterales bacterium]
MPSSASPNFSLRCGLAGWHYSHWDRIVYPAPKPRNFHPIQYLAQFFDVLEINTSFYQMLRPEVSSLWAQRVADVPNFRFTVKLNRKFTHERDLAPTAVAAFEAGLEPLRTAGKLGCVLMQFPWSFRFTQENRDYFIRLRRAFHRYPLVAEMRHSSWMCEEALGTFIDYHVGFANIDQPESVKAMPPTSYLTSSTGYVRLHGRNSEGWFRAQGFGAQRSDYLYTPAELHDWKQRIDRLRTFASDTYVVFTNDTAGKSVVNALQMQTMLFGYKQNAPDGMHAHYPHHLREYVERPRQERLFDLMPALPPARPRAVA